MCNEGGLDRILRVFVGAIIAAWGAMEPSWWGVIGLIPLITGLIGICPIYSVLHINTGCKTK